MRQAIVLAAALVLAGCGGHGHGVQSRFSFVPRYPTATHARESSNAVFSGIDWTLPAGTRPSAVYDWYTRKLQSLGWKVTQRNETGVHAEKGARTLDVGVRGQTLEAIVG